VQWWVGDPQVKTTPGTHKATWGSTVVVEATLVDAVNDGFEKYAQTEYTFKFPAKPACGDLLTLALTGSSTGGFVPLIAGALLLLGGAGIYFSRRLVTTSK
jgi:LPXTG-motif cell wall-anchored protein